MPVLCQLTATLQVGSLSVFEAEVFTIVPKINAAAALLNTYIYIYITYIIKNVSISLFLCKLCPFLEQTLSRHRKRPDGQTTPKTDSVQKQGKRSRMYK